MAIKLGATEVGFQTVLWLHPLLYTDTRCWEHSRAPSTGHYSVRDTLPYFFPFSAPPVMDSSRSCESF